MRTVDLGRTAAQAELLMIQRMVRRQAMRVVWGAVAAVFAIGVLIMLHVIAYTALAMVLQPLLDAAVLLGFDLLVMIVFVVFAVRGAPDAIEAEARAIRDQALTEMRESLAVSALLGPPGRIAMRTIGRKKFWSMTVGALGRRLLSRKRA